MTRYLDVGVVRIQRYLSRTPTLRGRRGASAALVAATSLDDAVFEGRAHRNRLAGEVDGVLSLVVDRPEEQRQVIGIVVAHMRKELPGAEFQLTWADAPDYLSAYDGDMKRQRESGSAVLDLPAGADFPLAVLCEICHVDPVDSHAGKVQLTADDGEVEERNVCADCARRHNRTVDQRTVEEELRKVVGASRLARGFNELSTLAGSGNQEHLATVHADGNGMGQFFAELARRNVANRAKVVGELRKHTVEAMAAATCVVRGQNDPALCVVPHLVGGDDVLVSLPAERAWAFTRAFVREFGQRMVRMARELSLPTDIAVPSMSAGLVFGRRNFPFALTVEHAEHWLRQAKSAAGGARASIGFADVVTDAGRASGRAGDCVELTALDAHRNDLDRLARLPHSSQHRLARALDHGGQQRAEAQAARLGQHDVITPFLPSPSRQDDPPIGLGTALRIARWWQP